MVRRRSYLSALLFLSALLLQVYSTSISADGILSSRISTAGRNLLQTKKPCPVNFEFMDYSIITGQCKEPDYSPDRCCPAFKQFACPYAEEINDYRTNCGQVMMSYINLSGNYPPALFASICRDGKEGLSCPPRQ